MSAARINEVHPHVHDHHKVNGTKYKGLRDPWFLFLEKVGIEKKRRSAIGREQFMDHQELFILDNGEPVYVSHPYYIDDDAFSYLTKFCELNGLHFDVDANSWYYPGFTVKLMIWKKGVLFERTN